MHIKTLEDLFHDELFDIYNAEQQLTKALPKMAEKATNPDLADGFRMHLGETEGQIERLDRVFALLDIDVKKETCEAMKGLLKEGEELMKHAAEGSVCDAAMIAAAQKVEHYEIASYGTLVALAKILGHNDAARILQETLDEEKATDEKLSELAEDHVNEQALRQAA